MILRRFDPLSCSLKEYVQTYDVKDYSGTIDRENVGTRLCYLMLENKNAS